MDVLPLVMFGGLTLVVWLHAIYFDRILRWPVPWSRRVVPRNRMTAGVLKVLAYAAAVLFSIGFGLMATAAVRGRHPPLP